MSKNVIKFVLSGVVVIVLICAIVGLLVKNDVISTSGNENKVEEEVPIAYYDIKGGTQIIDTQLSSNYKSQVTVTADTVLKKEEIIGKCLKENVSIKAGSTINKNDLIDCSELLYDTEFENRDFGLNVSYTKNNKLHINYGKNEYSLTGISGDLKTIVRSEACQLDTGKSFITALTDDGLYIAYIRTEEQNGEEYPMIKIKDSNEVIMIYKERVTNQDGSPKYEELFCEEYALIRLTDGTTKVILPTPAEPGKRYDKPTDFTLTEAVLRK